RTHIWRSCIHRPRQPPSRENSCTTSLPLTGRRERATSDPGASQSDAPCRPFFRGIAFSARLPVAAPLLQETRLLKCRKKKSPAFGLWPLQNMFVHLCLSKSDLFTLCPHLINRIALTA